MSSLALVGSPKGDAVPTYVLYSPQGSKPLAGLHIEGGGVSRYYDKCTRSQLLQIAPSTQVSFLRSTPSRIGGKSNSSSTLAAASQRIIVLQLFCEESARAAFSLIVEFVLQDKLGRHRIVFSSSFQKLQRCAQHVKVPLLCASPGMWLNFVFDVPNIHAALCGNSGGRLSNAELSQSRRLLHVTVSCSCICRVRRVLGMPQLPSTVSDTTMMTSPEVEWPLSLRLPAEVPMSTWIIRTCEEAFLHNQPAGATSTTESTDEPICPLEDAEPSARPVHTDHVAAHNMRAQRLSAASAEGLSQILSDATSLHSGLSVGVPSQAYVNRQDAGWSARDTYGDPMGVTGRGLRADEAQQQQQQSQQQQRHQWGCVRVPDSQQREIHDERTQLPSSRVFGRHHAAVQTNDILGELQIVGTVSGGVRTPANVRHVGTMHSGDAKRLVSGSGRQPRMQASGIERCTVPRTPEAGVAESTSPRRLDQLPRAVRDEDEKQMQMKIINSSTVHTTSKEESNMTPKLHTRTVANYQRTLDLMRERVERIQALIGEEAVDGESSASTRQNYGSDCEKGGDDSNKDEDRLDGRPRLHSATGRRSAKPWDMDHHHQQQKSLHLSPRPHSQQALGVDKCGLIPAPHTPTPHSGRCFPTVDATRTCTATCDDDDIDDGDDDDDERFTVNVCMSEDCGRPAVVVPAEATALDQKPPVPLPRSAAHAVDRISFSSTPTETAMEWSFRRATIQAEDDTPQLSAPSSPGATVSVPAMMRERRVHAVARRGRLGECVVESQQQENQWQQLQHIPQQEVMPFNEELLRPSLLEFQGCNMTASNTPLNSLRLSHHGAEEEGSSVCLSDYRRPPVAGKTEAAGNGHFIHLGSARVGGGGGGGGDDDDEDAGTIQSSRVASLPPRSPPPLQSNLLPLSPVPSPIPLPRTDNARVPNGRPSSKDNHHCHSTNIDTAERRGSVRVTRTGTPASAAASVAPPSLPPPLPRPDEVGNTPQPLDTAGGPFVFDPLLQCFLDLRSNAYVVTTRHAQNGRT